MKKRAQISVFLTIFLALACCSTVNSQDNATLPPQNLHQWGSVTLFNGLPSDAVRAVAQTPDGVLWFGTDSGLARFDGRRVQTVALENTETKKILALEISPAGELWIGTQNGAFRYRSGKAQKIPETQTYAVTAFLFGENAFLATENGVILKLRENAENNFQIEKIPEAPLKDGDNQLLKITSLAQIGDRIIAGTRSRSVLAVEDNRSLSAFSRTRPFFVNALTADRQGKIWLGADADNEGNGFFLLADTTQKISWETDTVLSIEADASGVWLGTNGNGLLRFRGEQLIEHFTFANTASGLRSNTIYAVFVDREGVLWLGTNRGVCRFDAASPFTRVLSGDSNSNFVRALYRAGDGQIYAGTNRGLFVFSEGVWREAGNFSPLAVYTIGEDLQKNLLVGTSAGLLGLDEKQKLPGDLRAVANFQGASYAAIFGRGVVQIENQAQIFSNDAPTALYADRENLWIGTARDGAFVYDGKSVRQEQVFENLRGAAIRKIFRDGANNLWIAGERGLFLYKNNQLENIISDKIVRDVLISGTSLWAAIEGGGILHLKRDEIFGWIHTALNVEQGLPSQKIFALLPLENNLLIGTNRGIVTYAPGNIQPKIIPTRILSQRLHEAEEPAQMIALNYPQNSLLVEVAGLSSRTFPEKFQYGFLLKNSRGEILEKRLSNDSQFAPANLAPGEYIIEARAFNNDLIASEPLQIKFSVGAAPFPQTAVTLGVLLVITLIALIWAVIETIRIRQRNRELAAARFDLANEAERERKRLARDLHDQTLADLRALMLMSDELPVETSRFRAEIEAVSTEIRRICEDLSPSVLENVGLLAALEFLLNHTLENCKFSADAEEESLNFSSNTQMQIYRIAQEVLTNIKHHSDAKCVEMKIEISENREFILTVEDDGASFMPVGNSPKGRGISNIKSRAALINAEIAWRKSEQGGTIFQLKKAILEVTQLKN